MTRRKRDRIRRARNLLLREEAIGLGRWYALNIVRVYDFRELLNGAAHARRWKDPVFAKPRFERHRMRAALERAYDWGGDLIDVYVK